MMSSIHYLPAVKGDKKIAVVVSHAPAISIRSLSKQYHWVTYMMLGG